MTDELILFRPCEHGETEPHSRPGEEDEELCPGGSEERLDPEQVLYQLHVVDGRDYDDYPTSYRPANVRDILDALASVAGTDTR